MEKDGSPIGINSEYSARVIPSTITVEEPSISILLNAAANKGSFLSPSSFSLYHILLLFRHQQEYHHLE